MALPESKKKPEMDGDNTSIVDTPPDSVGVKILKDPDFTNDDSVITIRRTELIQRRKALLDWTQIAANILVPLAIGIAAFGLYLEKLQGGRDTASRHIELFYSEGLNFSQLTLFKLWRDQDLSVLENAVSRRFVDEFVSRRIEASGIEKSVIESSIVSLTTYFDRAEVCVASGRCDESELIDHVGFYGRDFYCIYAGEIAELRNERFVVYLGAGLQKFADRTGGCKRRAN